MADMCVIAVAILASRRWPLVIAANRDEFHARPTRALARWEEQPHILAGKNLQSGGTWRGVSERGLFAAVTNVKDTQDSAPYDLSRGELVLRYLCGESIKVILHQCATKFAPFNLLTLDGQVAEFVSNAPRLVRRRLGQGVFTLSNALDNAPLPKSRKLQRLVEKWLAADSADLMNLLEALGPDGCVDVDTHCGDNSHCEDRQGQIFVRSSVHGTRSSTTLAEM